jgi:hypothetical protein
MVSVEDSEHELEESEIDIINQYLICEVFIGHKLFLD